MASSPTSTSTVTASSAPDRPPPAERIARHERVVVLGAILLVAVLAAGWTASGAGMERMDAMAGMSGPPAPFGLVLAMWWLMMVAMMLPSAAPAILLYASVRRARSDSAIPAAGGFLLGYVLSWALISIAATALQLGAVRSGLLDAMGLKVNSSHLAGAMLIAAGIYQWSPAKSACLRQCRSPAAFFAAHWRPGPLGAVRLGMMHGGYCVGCCWLLMALLFVGGVMNLAWIVALAALVGAEKLLPFPRITVRLAGTAFIAWGAAVLLV